MDVSQFELVFKPQSPVPPSDTVLQGYFLEISNLEDQAYKYQLEFVTSSITDPDRSLFGNTVVFVDVPGDDNQSGVFTLSGDLDAKSFFLNKFIEIPAHGTALVAVLPSDPFSMPGAPPPTPDFECRGYVRITLPVVRPSLGRFFKRVAQSKTPVKVMLTPQNRATYLTSAGAINDQTQSSVPLASGMAVNEIEPDKPKRPVLDRPEVDLELIRDLELEIATGRSGADLIAGLMAEVAEDPGGAERLNAVMADAGIRLAVERRAPKAVAKGKGRPKSSEPA